MKKWILSFVLFGFLLFPSCTARTPLENAPSSEGSSSSSEQSSQYSELSLLAEAETALIEIYKPMLEYFPNQINAENPLSPDTAYHCFQCYALAERIKGNECYVRWESWLIEGEEQPLGYDQHYSADIVENFTETYLDVSTEKMQEIPFYNPQLNAYEVSMWGEKDSSTLTINDCIAQDDRCIFLCTYDSGYGRTGDCTITLKKIKTGFCLDTFQSNFSE